jgi:hypothetical protein
MIDESKVLGLIRRQKETGLTISAFCNNEGIPKSTYYYWRKKMSKEPGRRFIPLLVNTIPSTLSGPTKCFTTVENTHPISGDAFPMEITYPNGTTLRLKHPLDLAGLRSLVLLVD